MRTRIINFLLIIIWIVTFLISCKKTEEDVTDLCNCTSMPITLDTYVYPIRPSDSEWSLLTDAYQRVEACQLPDSLLKTISTQGLIETCVNHPLLFELIFSDLSGGGLQKAIEKLMTMFNCLEELSLRPNAGSELLRRYLMMNPCCVENKSVEPGEFANSYSEYEMILAQECFLEQFSNKELIELIRKALFSYYNKVKYDNYFSWNYGMNTSALLIARGMLHIQHEPFLQEMEKYYYIKRFVNTSALPTNEENFNILFTKIVGHAENILKK